MANSSCGHDILAGGGFDTHCRIRIFFFRLPSGKGGQEPVCRYHDGACICGRRDREPLAARLHGPSKNCLRVLQSVCCCRSECLHSVLHRQFPYGRVPIFASGLCMGLASVSIYAPLSNRRSVAVSVRSMIYLLGCSPAMPLECSRSASRVWHLASCRQRIPGGHSFCDYDRYALVCAHYPFRCFQIEAGNCCDQCRQPRMLSAIKRTRLIMRSISDAYFFRPFFCISAHTSVCRSGENILNRFRRCGIQMTAPTLMETSNFRPLRALWVRRSGEGATGASPHIRWLSRSDTAKLIAADPGEDVGFAEGFVHHLCHFLNCPHLPVHDRGCR